MSLQETVSAERVHIAWFGLRNAGKSSLVNAVTGQDVSIVSEIRGTTTDPVRKAMELLPLGPVVIIDTPGLDDEGELGRLRIERTNRILAQTDIAVLAVDAAIGLTELDREILTEIASRKIPFAVAFTKADLVSGEVREKRAGEAISFTAGKAVSPEDTAAEKATESGTAPYIFTSAVTGEGIRELKELLGSFAPKVAKEKRILTDLVASGSTVVLVTPIDSSAPKGRLILPQQLTLRELLDAHCTAIVCQPEELADTLASLRRAPALVVTDSQAFAKVNAVVPADVRLTSFSMLFARYKGNLKTLVEGAMAIDRLSEGDRVLISEGCTHHRQCEDIGTVKLPAWIEKHVGFRPQFEFTSGGDFPSDLSEYKLVIHCGGCTLPEREMQRRLDTAAAAGVPIVNYGIAIAHMNGILARSLSVFEENAD
ncbi:MAG: [Lachnospiraceae bacterium]|nr:[FeFe] hydrogenase H-cluster maturation GTPase HydF [Lachnospiraceae bacterium]